MTKFFIKNNFLLTVIIVFYFESSFAGMADGNSSSIDIENSNPYKDNLEAIKEGKALWAKTGCYSCHGGKAEGGVGPNLTDDTWIYKPTDKTLFKTISKGRSGTTMVGWDKELNREEIWKVISYIRSLYSGSSSKIIW